MRKFMSAIAVVATLLIGFAPHAAASTPVTATGAFGYSLVSQTLIRTAGTNTVFYATVASVPYSGDLTGPATDTEIDIVHSDGSFTTHGTEVCIAGCMLGGRTGGYTSVYEFTGSNWYTNGGYPYQGHLTFTGGTGGLAGLHGGGTFGGTLAIPSFYTYTYSFAP
jgi:hypothetical protein